MGVKDTDFVSIKELREQEDLLDIQAMANEELCPELALRVTEEGPLGPMICHPLVHTVSFVPGLANRQLVFKRAQLEEALFESDWSRWVFTHERPYRTDALLEVRRRFVDSWQELGDLPAEVWTDTENIHQHLDDWARIMEESDGRDWMSPDEAKALREMPDRIEVWRGECNDGEVSWTLDQSIATFFAKRETHAGTGMISHGFVFKRDVLCYLSRRSEEEIIVPDRSKVQEVDTFPAI